MYLCSGQQQLLKSLYFFTVISSSLLQRTNTHKPSSHAEQTWRVCHEAQAERHHEDAEHHVIVVDEKDQLVSSGWKFSRHLQNKIFHFDLKLWIASDLDWNVSLKKHVFRSAHLQLAEESVGPLVRKRLIYTDNSRGELSVAPCDLKHNTAVSKSLHFSPTSQVYSGIIMRNKPHMNKFTLHQRLKILYSE